MPRLRRMTGSSTKPSMTIAIRTQRISMRQAFQTPLTIGQPGRRPVENSWHPADVQFRAPEGRGTARPAADGPQVIRGIPAERLGSVPMSDRHISQHFETLAIHAGNTADPLTGAVVPPIYQVSTYKQDGVGGLRSGGYEYSRTSNPTRTALEECLTALEGGTGALAFASGMAAEDCLLRTICSPGDHVLIPDDAYGGTFRLFSRVYEQWGVSHTPVRISDLAAVRDALAAR